MAHTGDSLRGHGLANHHHRDRRSRARVCDRARIA